MAEQAGQSLPVLGRQRCAQIVLHLIEHPIHAPQLPDTAPGEGHLVTPSMVRVRRPVDEALRDQFVDRRHDVAAVDAAPAAELGLARRPDLLDEGRHDDAHNVYHGDVVVRSPRGGELHGLDEVTAYLKRSQVEGEHTQDVHGDVLVHVDGDHAKATANELVYFYRNGVPPHRTSGLRAARIAVRTPAGWRFSEIHITLAWIHEK